MEVLYQRLCFTAFIVILCSSLSAGNLVFHREGLSTSLDCTGTGDVQYWLLNGKGAAIDANSPDGIFMNQNGSLYFDEVRKEHHGNHVCVTRTENTVEAFEVEMKVRFLPPKNLWEERYRKMFITGLIASLVCLLFFLGVFLVDKYRWKDPEPKHKAHLMDEAYINQAMEADGIASVRM